MLGVHDTVECIRLAAEHPASPGGFRVFNQFTEQFLVLAEMIRDAYPDPVRIRIDDPRIEATDRYYHGEHSRMIDLGLEPHQLNDTLTGSLFAVAEKHRGHADPSLVAPACSGRQLRGTSDPKPPERTPLRTSPNRTTERP